jgi:hypothetical protein
VDVVADLSADAQAAEPAQQRGRLFGHPPPRRLLQVVTRGPAT